MSRAEPGIFCGSGISQVWSQAFLSMLQCPSHEKSPMFLRIELGDNASFRESLELRRALDQLLALNPKHKGIDTVASTIFPLSRWVIADGDRDLFFSKYRRDYPRYKRLDPQNRKGTYFGRMIEPVPGLPDGQLEHVIGIYSRQPSAVRMKLQVSIFDAAQDHDKGARPSFPCMQQISFAPHEQALDLNAFYASQQFLLKGYGNYLGLINLGQFTAHQMGLKLRAVNVFAGIAKTDVSNRRSPEYLRLIQVAEALCSHPESRG